MRFIYAILLLLMLLFMAVQYNDPDGWLWIIYYGVPAAWCAVSVFQPKKLVNKTVFYALVGSAALALAGVVFYWPAAESFWSMSVWYEVETAREGMGLMIVLSVLLVVVWGAINQRRSKEAAIGSMNGAAAAEAS